MGRTELQRKILGAEAAAAAIPDGATIALCGSGTLLEPDFVLSAIEARFLATGHPRDLTIVHALGIGDGRGSGMGRFAHEGMVARIIGGHWSWSSKMQALARDEKVAAYSFPAGAIMGLVREIGAGRPGLITHIGLGTFADPEISGGRCNASAREQLVEAVQFDGKRYLRYKPLKIDVAIVRGSVADPSGNISTRHEAADLDAYTVALAAHNSGGKVFAQVRDLVDHPFVPARQVRIPGVLIDAVVQAPDQFQTIMGRYDPTLSGEVETSGPLDPPELPSGIRAVIARRAAQEFVPGASVNFGFGIPGGIPALLEEQGMHGLYWGSVEQGIHNGQMLDGAMFGAARFPQAIMSSPDQFDFYRGGGVDLAFLGMGEMDGRGNVNVSMLGDTLVGPGGFIDITAPSRKVVFCGAFEAKGLDIEVSGSALRIKTPGAVPKLVAGVNHVTFSGPVAAAAGHEVLYVTERAVFRLGAGAVELIEVAEGVDIRADVLERMDFAPLIRDVRVAPVLRPYGADA
jgi:acyl CoA:acetate/3-ketoacid CoA transferase